MHPMDMSVQEIAGMSDPVLRNLLITQRYHEFAVRLRDAGAGEDATWCAFAVWASKTAGATIRGEVLPAKAKQFMTESPAQEVLQRFNHGVTGWAWKHLTHDHIGQVIEDVTDDVSKQIAEGNVLVFAELAPLFTALIGALHLLPGTSQELAAALAPVLAPLASDKDGVAVVAAFEAYEHALFDPAARPALVLRANTLAVAHEQRRLQPAISAALDAAISDTLKKVIERDVVGHLPTAEVRHLLNGLTGEVCSVLDQAWDTALTEAIMQLVTPNETLDLRRDIPPPPGGMFPPELRDLSGTEAESAVAQWDRTHGKGAPSGAHDWAVLEQRMNFIVNLFRSRQRDASLFNPPFSDAQLAVLAQGQLPPGPL
jgi:hypothetical protein